MCSVSAIYDYGRDNPPWDFRYLKPFYPGNAQNTIPMPSPTDEQIKKSIQQYMEMIVVAKKYDVATKQPDCEDPKKAEFMKEVLDRLEAIEKRLSAPAP